MNHKLRSINTRIWSDKWFEQIEPEHKLLFIYLITNSLNNMLGIYEISTRKMAFETGITEERVLKALKGFQRDRKVLYKNGYITLINFISNQNYHPNTKKSAIDIYNSLPEKIKIKNLQVADREDYNKGFQSLIEAFETLRKIEDEYEEEVICAKTKKTKNPLSSDKPKTPSINSLSKNIFLDFYKKTTGLDYYFQAKDAGSLKQLLKKLRFSIETKKGGAATDEETLHGLEYFLSNIRDSWILENLSIPILNSKYNEILNQIKNDTTLQGSSTKSYAKTSKGLTPDEQRADLMRIRDAAVATLQGNAGNKYK